jgi:hypothetical protein
VTRIVPEAALVTGFDALSQALKNANENERKTAVRWFNRLYYDVEKWNQEFIRFLDSYPGFKKNPSRTKLQKFKKKLEDYRVGLDETGSEVKGTLCKNLRILRGRLPRDFEWLCKTDPGAFRQLDDTVSEAYATEEEICNMAGTIVNFIWDIYDETYDQNVFDKIKERISEYKETSRREVSTLLEHATSVGIQLLSVTEYEEILSKEGSSNSAILMIGDITQTTIQGSTNASVTHPKIVKGTPMTDHRFQTILAYSFGCIFVAAILALVVFIPKPTTEQFEIFKLVIALAAGGVAAVIPGLLDLHMRLGLSTTQQSAIRAGGALAVFLIAFFYSPAHWVVTVG